MSSNFMSTDKFRFGDVHCAHGNPSFVAFFEKQKNRKTNYDKWKRNSIGKKVSTDE